MGTELLDQLQDLRMRSLMSDLPCAEHVCMPHAAEPKLMVSVGDWVLTKNQFIMLWFWVVSGTRAYSPQIDHDAWNMQISDLNPHLMHKVPAWARNKLLEYVANNLPVVFKSFTPEQHKQILRRILSHNT